MKGDKDAHRRKNKERGLGIKGESESVRGIKRGGRRQGKRCV